MFSGLVVEPAAATRRQLRAVLEKDPGFRWIGAWSNGSEGCGAIERHRPDLVFLNMALPGSTAFDVIEQVHATGRPAVVLVGERPEQAVEAYEVEAFDFVITPLDEGRLARTLERVKQHLHRCRMEEDYRERLLQLFGTLQQRSRAWAPPERRTRIAAREHDRIVLVDIPDILWIEASGNYVCLHTPQQTVLLNATMREMEAQLRGWDFLRVHRSHIVNLQWVRQLKPVGSGDYLVVLDDGTEVTASRTYSDRLRDAFALAS